MIAMMGLASVIGIQITSLYPDVGEAIKPLHGKVQPRTRHNAFGGKTVILMWSRDGNLDIRQGAIFEPNHIVAIKHIQASEKKRNDDGDLETPPQKESCLITKFRERLTSSSKKVQMGRDRIHKAVQWLQLQVQ